MDYRGLRPAYRHRSTHSTGNLHAARNVAQAVIDAIDRLETFPYLGRSGELKGTRELVSAPYVVVYRVTSEVVEILHIWHGAQDWR